MTTTISSKRLTIGAAIALALAFAGGALADYTVARSSARWRTTTVYPVTDGGTGVRAEICADVLKPDGGVADHGCSDIFDVAAGACANCFRTCSEAAIERAADRRGW